MARSRHIDLYSSLRFHYEVKATAEIARPPRCFTWDVPDHDENFQNTAQYVRSSTAAGRRDMDRQACRLTPVWTMLGARLVNGLRRRIDRFPRPSACAGAGPGNDGTTLLLLSDAVRKFASISQDASIISLSILAIALASRILARRGRPARGIRLFMRSS